MVSLGTPIYISVRAITNKFGDDISRGLRGARGNISRDGEDLGKRFTAGFNKGIDTNAFRRVVNGLKSMSPAAEASRKSFATLVRTSYTLGTALTLVVGGISSVISALGSLVGAAGGAVATVAVLGNAIFALGAGMVASKLALSGVGSALQKYKQQAAATAANGVKAAIRQAADDKARLDALRRIEDAERALARVIEANQDRLLKANEAITEAQLDLNRAMREGREEIQQIGFDAEDAALAETRAALELERARETLARVQDLPPNDRARQEAELAFEQAQLNYEKAADANADLAKEQQRLARTGVNGLDSVIEAREKLADAEENKAAVVKDALQDEEDALRDLARAREDANRVDDKIDSGGAAGAAAAAAGVAAWDEGLNAAQKRFVVFLAGLQPQFDELSRIASEAFLPDLQTAIEILMAKAYPVVATGIGLVADAMGRAVIAFASLLTSEANLEKLTTLFERSATLIEIFGRIFGSTFDAIFSILVATAPLAERFFGFIAEQMEGFAAHLNSVAGNQELQTFFDRASYTAGLFGTILGNVFQGIGAIIDANVGPGTGADFLLSELARVTDAWGNSDGLTQFFRDVAINSRAIFGALGDLLGIMGRVGADQSIGEAFTALREGAPALQNIIQTTIDAAPSLAGLVVTITEIVSALQDTGAMQVFFDVLNGIFGAVLGFVSDPANKEVLDFFGRIFAVFSAIGLTTGLLGAGFRIFTGVIIGLLSPIATLVGLLSAKNLLLIRSKIETGILIAMYGKDMVVALGRWIAAQATLFAAKVKEIAQGAILLGMYAKDAVLKGASAVATIALSAAQKAAAAAQWLLNAAMSANPIGLVVAAIVALVGGLIWFFTQTEVGKKIWEEFTRFLGEAFANTVRFLREAWENIQKFFDAGFKWIDRWIFKPLAAVFSIIGLAFQEMGRRIREIWEGIQTILGVGWSYIDKYIFNPIRWGVALIQTAFENVQLGIATAWDKIKKATADPINFVIDTVYNNGLRSFWNDLAGALGMDNLKLPKVPRVAFKDGGVLPGYTPGRDVHKFYSPTGGVLHLSGGEAIMRPEWVRAIGGPKAVERLNRSARGGGTGDGTGTRRFAGGGIIDFVGDVLDNLGDISKIVGDFIADPGKAVQKHVIDGLLGPLLGGNNTSGIQKLAAGVPIKIATFLGDAVKKLFGAGEGAKGGGGNAMGWQAMWNIVKSQFPNATLNSSVRPGAKTVNGDTSYHALGRAIDLPPSMAIFDFLAKAFPNSRELIYTPAGIRQLQNGRNHLWTGAVAKMHTNHVHWAMANGGTVMPSPGGSIVNIAEAGRPERVEPLDPNGISERDKAWARLFTEGFDRGTTIFNITQLPHEDGQALAERIDRMMSEHMRAGSTH